MSVALLPPVQSNGQVDPPPVPSSATTERVAFSPKRMLAWLGAMVGLWFVLTALSDGGQAGIARSLAGLLLVGAIIALGPGAISNAQALVK